MNPNATRIRTVMALFTTLLSACPAVAVQVFNEDVAILDPTPGIIFNDTDAIGEEWYIRGREEYFSVFDPRESTDVLTLNASTQSVALGYFSSVSVSALSALAMGHSATASDHSSVALGHGATATCRQCLAAGHLAESNGWYSVALGREASSAGSSSTAIGVLASSPAADSVAIGYGALSFGSASAAFGAGASANSHSSIALGVNAKSSGHRSVALGYRAFTNREDSIVLGATPGLNGATAYANVGMGTNTPDQAVVVERSAAAARFQLTSFTSTASEAPQYIQRRARGTRTAPTAVQNNDNLGLFSFRGYTPGGFGGSRATITAQAAGNFTNSSTPTRLIFATTPVGQTSPQQVLVITPDGKVQVNGQNLNVPDYVFEDDYELMPLEELRSFIEENGHLPGIASASEVNEGGLDLAGSHLDHLRKIEELTLYTLQQEVRIDQQSRAITDQHARIDKLEKLVAHLLESASSL